MLMKRPYPFPRTHMQKQKRKRKPQHLTYAVCCLIGLFKKEKIYNYKSLKRNMMKTIPLNSPQKSTAISMIIAATEVL